MLKYIVVIATVIISSLSFANLKELALTKDTDFYEIDLERPTPVPIRGIIAEETSINDGRDIANFEGPEVLQIVEENGNLYAEFTAELGRLNQITPGAKIKVYPKILSQGTVVQYKTQEDIFLYLKVNGSTKSETYSLIKYNISGYFSKFGLISKKQLEKSSTNVPKQFETEKKATVKALINHQKGDYLFYFVFCPENRNNSCVIMPNKDGAWLTNDSHIFGLDMLARAIRKDAEPSMRLRANVDSPEGIYWVFGSLFSYDRVDSSGKKYTTSYGYRPRLGVTDVNLNEKSIKLEIEPLKGNKTIFVIGRDSLVPQEILTSYWAWESYFAHTISGRSQIRIHETTNPPNYPENVPNPQFRMTHGCFQTGHYTSNRQLFILEDLFKYEILNRTGVEDENGNYTIDPGENYHWQDPDKLAFMIVIDLPLDKPITQEDVFEYLNF